MAFSRKKFEAIRDRITEYMAENANTLAVAKREKRPIRTAHVFLEELDWLCNAAAALGQRRALPKDDGDERDPKQRLAAFAQKVRHATSMNRRLIERGGFVSLTPDYFTEGYWLAGAIEQLVAPRPEPDDLTVPDPDALVPG